YLVRIRLGAPCHWKSFDCEQVFCGVRNSVQRAAIVPAPDFLFRCLRLFESNLRGQESVSVVARAELLAAIEIPLGQIDRRELLRFDAFREFAHRQIENLFARHSGCSSGSLWSSRWLWRGLSLPLYQRFQ